MPAYIARRLAYSIPVLLIASFLLFAFVRATFDPTARLRASRDPNAVQRERERLGLDRPVVVQYKQWLVKFVQGDWGESSRTRERVFPMVRRAMWNTLQLIGWGVLVSTVLAVAIGVFSAVRQYSLADFAFTSASFVGLAMPPFWFGLIAIQFLAVYPKDWFHLARTPLFFVGLHSTSGAGLGDYARHLVLPVMTLTVQIVAAWSRYERASMLDALNADYVRAAKAKGLSPRAVVFKHALRNALMPLVTVMALDIGALFGGLIITESIFSIPGMGRLFFDALIQGDTNVLVVWTVLTAAFVIVFNLLADVLYGVLDPRIRYS
ncbi:MAG: peptide/nickel transport system permease protein [Actinomycetota bacterium]|nr:peptide/nickel transport system permease protein [Actinomycetota bacterium]